MMSEAASEADPVANSGTPGIKHRFTFGARVACRAFLMTWRAP